MAYELWRNRFGPEKNDFAHIFDKIETQLWKLKARQGGFSSQLL